MSNQGGTISIERSARRVGVDNRISLRNYYRIADSLIRQANIYRAERNIIDLYVMLLRFSSLVTETIPSHRDYRFSPQSEKVHFKKKLLDALNELERLKPDVKLKLDQINRSSRDHVDEWALPRQNGFADPYTWPAPKNQIPVNTSLVQVQRFVGSDGVSQKNSLVVSNKTREDHFRKSLLSIPPPKVETLMRHSILGPNGLNGQWQPPIVDTRVQYPSNLDLTPIDITSLLNPIEEVRPDDTKKESESTEQEKAEKKTPLEEILSLQEGVITETTLSNNELDFLNIESLAKVDIGRDPSPPPVLAQVHDLPDLNLNLNSNSVDFQDQLIQAQTPIQVHISTAMMESFMRIAKSNTDRNLETCGVLAGSLKNRKFFVTALVIPKQESTSDSCSTTNEEEVFEYQDKNSLFSLGWIHTHPTQSCFMSSIDVHTQYSYQVMLPEAIAIVMAPSDSSRNHGIFRLTVPGGMSVVKKCSQSGFHPHLAPPSGGPLYTSADVYMDRSLKFDVADLR